MELEEQTAPKKYHIQKIIHNFTHPIVEVRHEIIKTGSKALSKAIKTKVQKGGKSKIQELHNL